MLNEEFGKGRIALKILGIFGVTFSVIYIIMLYENEQWFSRKIKGFSGKY
jgi:hypothetical protein